MSEGFVLWFTGLSGSGKTTLATLGAAELGRRGLSLQVFDGDQFRQGPSRGLGFSREDRDENIRRIGHAAGLVVRTGTSALVATVSPYRHARNEIRRSVRRFIEVYTECSLAALLERDPKGLYREAQAGRIRQLTGFDDPYEPPENPEVHVHTDRELPEESLGAIVRYLEQHALIGGTDSP